MSKKKLRRAQTITPFGVGSLLDLQGEGFIVESIDRWTSKPRKLLQLPRLSLALGNLELRSFSGPGLPGRQEEALKVTRFPRWYHCAACEKLDYIDRQMDRDLADGAPRCMTPDCNNTMSPMRFVAYCDEGHMSDIDWFSWCHRSSDAQYGHCSDRKKLYFKSSGLMGGDFNAMKIVCRACNRKQDFLDLQRGNALPWLLRDRPIEGSNCCGKQPWQRKVEAVKCKENMRFEPRGSASIYQAKVYSALDVEVSTDGESFSQNYPDLDAVYEDLLEDYGSRQGLVQSIKDGDHKMRIERRQTELGITYEEAVEYVVALASQPEDSPHPAVPAVINLQKHILLDELQVFREGSNIDRDNLRIQFIPMDAQKEAATIFSKIGQVKRLREVRALISFSRGKGDQQIPVDLGDRKLGWLPAIEAIGEGIYFELNPDTLKAYLDEHGSSVDSLIRGQQEALANMQENYQLDIPGTQLFILAHTLSHFLMRQLTFNSGYSSSALRERLYIDDETGYAGILVYTTDTDSEGTLGGLVDQARPEVIQNIVRQIREAALWCSADPVCRETENQGFRNLNRSACHCCSLVSETSCTYQNAMLNRLLLGGMGKERQETLGFLEYSRGP